MVFHADLEKVVRDNAAYRKVVYTSAHMQVVLMSLEPGECIELETHREHDQFFRIESGRGIAIVAGVSYSLEDGVGLVVPAGVPHFVRNTGATPLKLYTIYSPPEHPAGRKDERAPPGSYELEKRLKEAYKLVKD